MDKDAITSVGVIGLLLVVVIVATVINNRQQLVATRPQIDTVVSNALETMLGVEIEAEAIDQINQGNTSCPLGCSLNPTPEPVAGQKEQIQADPIPYVRDVITSKHTSELSSGSLQTVYSLDAPLWWRSDDGYRIRAQGGKSFTAQVVTTATAYQLAPTGGKKQDQDVHPALRHPLLGTIQKEITSALKDLDFKVAKLDNCPVNDAYDPFNNCIAAYTHKKNNQKCLLLARYGTHEVPLDPQNPALRIELTCSDTYDQAYALASPYLYAVNIINPEWLVPDSAVYSVNRDDQEPSIVRVEFGYQQEAPYRIAYFQQLDKGLQLLGNNISERSCSVAPDSEGVVSLQCQ